MTYVSNMGDFDLYRGELDGGFYEVKVMYHDNVNIKDKDILVKESDWKAIEATLKEIEEDSDLDTDSAINYIEELLDI